MKSDGCLVLHYQRVHHQKVISSSPPSDPRTGRRVGVGSTSSLPLPSSPSRMTPLQQQQPPLQQQQASSSHRRPSDRSSGRRTRHRQRQASSGRMLDAADNDDHESMSSSSTSSSSTDDDNNDNEGEGNDSITISSSSSSSSSTSLDDEPPESSAITNNSQAAPQETTSSSRHAAFPPSRRDTSQAGYIAAASEPIHSSTSAQLGRGSFVRKRSCSTLSGSVVGAPPPPPPSSSSAVAHLTASSASASPNSSPSPSHSPSSSGRAVVVMKTAPPPAQDNGPDAAASSQSDNVQQQLSSDADMNLLAAANRANAAAEAAQLRHRQVLFARLEASAPMGKLSLINLARQGIGPAEARLLGDAIRANPHLSVLKLAYNQLGNDGAEAIAAALGVSDGINCLGAPTIRHHENVSVLDVGFNGIGDPGCEALAVRVVAGNYKIRTLCLTANSVTARGALALAGAIVVGTGLSRLLVAANPIRSQGVESIATAIVRHDTQQIAALTASVAATVQPSVAVRGMVELDVGSTSIDSAGFMTIPAMLLTNATLQTLCLENNNIDDNDMVLLSQSLAQNKNVPLRTLKLSFNQISCAGIECLMNAVWGSPTLRDLSLDNNKIQDRGAQLCAVVLTSIALEKLDLSFNRVTTVGLKALMKNLSENSSMQTLGFSGIPIDLNGSKAVSFALAYNNSLRAIYLDNCSTGYSSQRHIVAGIVSNRRSSLRVLTGFSIGPVARTLGMPNLPESWSNDQVLGFFRLMWQQWLLKSGRGVAPSQDDDAVRGPAPPAAVAAAAKITLSALAVGTSSGMDALFHTEAHEKPVAEGPPVEPTASALLERTDSGTMRVPTFPNALMVTEDDDAPVEFIGSYRRPERAAATAGPNLSTVRGPLENPERRNRNLQWLRQHFRSLGEVGRLPFSNADLWQLHQYYFSPPFSAADDADDGRHSRSPFSSASPTSGDDSATGIDRPGGTHLPVVAPPPTPAFGMSGGGGGGGGGGESPPPLPRMGRAVSFQALGDAFAASGFASAGYSSASSSSSPSHELPHKRRSGRTKGRRAIREEEEDEDVNYDHRGPLDNDDGPAVKRAKGVGKPRIAYYPRVMAKIQALGTKPMDQSLSLLRQLKYAENVIFAGRDPYAAAGTSDAAQGDEASAYSAASAPAVASSPWSSASTPSPSIMRPVQLRGSEDMDEDDGLAHTDVEMILLDLL